MKEYGLFGVFVPKEYGGASGSALNLCIVVEELARACGGIGVGFAVNALGSFPLLVGGTASGAAEYFSSATPPTELMRFQIETSKMSSPFCK